jgi:hypothetical protein
MVFAHFPGFAGQGSFASGFHERNISADSHGYRAVGIAGDCKRKITQRKQRAAMRAADAIPVVRLHRHAYLGVAGRYFNQLNPVARGKLVAFEKLLNGFHIVNTNLVLIS